MNLCEFLVFYLLFKKKIVERKKGYYKVMRYNSGFSTADKDVT